jgi:hypothetical protein
MLAEGSALGNMSDKWIRPEGAIESNGGENLDCLTGRIQFAYQNEGVALG